MSDDEISAPIVDPKSSRGSLRPVCGQRWALEYHDEIVRTARSDAFDAWTFQRILTHIEGTVDDT